MLEAQIIQQQLLIIQEKDPAQLEKVFEMVRLAVDQNKFAGLSPRDYKKRLKKSLTTIDNLKIFKK